MSLRRVRSYLIKAALALFVVEVLCFVVVRFLLPAQVASFLRQDLDALSDRVTDSTFAKRPDVFDKELGWDLPPGLTGGSPETGCRGVPWNFAVDAEGSREVPVTYTDRWISLYGDSYTFGAEVNDDATWQFFLSELTKSHVLNFGVWGYGFDQALLKLARNIKRGLGTPVVILGIYSEDIRRVVGAYRPFLTGEFSPIEFKPVLVRRGSTFAWETAHLMAEPSRAEFLRSFEAAKAVDYWYAQNGRRPTRSFPYAWTLFRLAKFIAVDHALGSRNMWNVEEAQAIFVETMRRFRELGKEHGFLPVVLLMPEAGELNGYSEGKPAYYEDFIASAKRSGALDGIPVVDVYQAKFDPRQFTYWGGDEICHPSAYGNRTIAEAIMSQAGNEIRAAIAKAKERR